MLQIALVGAPNKGKSTFFKAATLKDVEIADYPFTTIDANVGIGFVSAECPSKELNLQCSPNNSKCTNDVRFIPVELVDVAGLVPDAYLGKGRGNQFLDDLRQASVLIQIIDISGKTNESGESVDEFDPAKEIEFLENEIGMWIFGIFQRNWKKMARMVEMKQKKPEEYLEENFSSLGIKAWIANETASELQLSIGKLNKWPEEDIKRFAFSIMKKSKPIIIAANKADVAGSKEKIDELRNRFPGKKIVPVSAEAELAFRNASEKGMMAYSSGDSAFELKEEITEQQKGALDFLKKNVLDAFGSTGIQDCLNDAVFDVMEQIVVYPVENENKFTDKHGNVLPDAILIKNGSTALDLAFKVHTDIGKGFIRAVNARTKQVVGKDYVLKNNDIIKIVSGK